MARAPGHTQKGHHGERQELSVCRTVTEMSTICNHKKPGFSVFLSYENSLVMPAL